MKIKKILTLFGMLFSVLILVNAFAFDSQKGDECETCIDWKTDGCTVIIVGKEASTDGSVMTTHTCDCGLCDWTWRYIPAADHEPGSMRKIYHINQFRTWDPKIGLKWERYTDDFTGLEIPQVPHTHGYNHGAFGYMNDMQVALGES
ncbi:MAG: C69 family dipeptidase, partial [Candidatus Aminicenantes bacterium]